MIEKKNWRVLVVARVYRWFGVVVLFYSVQDCSHVAKYQLGSAHDIWRHYCEFCTVNIIIILNINNKFIFITCWRWSNSGNHIARSSKTEYRKWQCHFFKTVFLSSSVATREHEVLESTIQWLTLGPRIIATEKKKTNKTKQNGIKKNQ